VKLLFVCTHNACRSILGEVIARKLGAGLLQTASAGSSPSGRVHPLTLQYLNDHGYATDELCSESLDDMQDFEPDVVITVCDRAAKEPCPVWLGSAVQAHWGLPDPSHLEGSDAERFAAFDAVAAIIEARISALLQSPFEVLQGEQLAVLLQSIAEQH
jgi:arsenate reductase